MCSDYLQFAGCFDLGNSGYMDSGRCNLSIEKGARWDFSSTVSSQPSRRCDNFHPPIRTDRQARARSFRFGGLHPGRCTNILRRRACIWRMGIGTGWHFNQRAFGNSNLQKKRLLGKSCNRSGRNIQCFRRLPASRRFYERTL